MQKNRVRPHLGNEPIRAPTTVCQRLNISDFSVSAYAYFPCLSKNLFWEFACMQVRRRRALFFGYPYMELKENLNFYLNLSAGSCDYET
jgi:hypothetical protein